MQLRVLDREESTIKTGERYPIETSSFSSLGSAPLNIPGLSTAGLSSTLQGLGITPAQLQAAATATIPQVQYQDIGLTLKVTPSIEGANRVSLKFDLTLSSLAGSSLNGLPLLNNREYNAITSVRVGESALLVSSLSRQESNAITGIPGLSEIAGVPEHDEQQQQPGRSRTGDRDHAAHRAGGAPGGAGKDDHAAAQGP